jgi:hypothetical protein
MWLLMIVTLSDSRHESHLHQCGFLSVRKLQEAGYDLDLYYDELETASKDDKYISISHSTIFQP